MTPDEVRQKWAQDMPEYVAKLDEIIRKPGRNSQTQLSALKLVLDRIVPAVAATTISSPAGGPVEVTLRLVRAKKKDEPGTED